MDLTDQQLQLDKFVEMEIRAPTVYYCFPPKTSSRTNHARLADRSLQQLVIDKYCGIIIIIIIILS